MTPSEADFLNDKISTMNNLIASEFEKSAKIVLCLNNNFCRQGKILHQLYWNDTKLSRDTGVKDKCNLRKLPPVIRWSPIREQKIIENLNYDSFNNICTKTEKLIASENADNSTSEVDDVDKAKEDPSSNISHDEWLKYLKNLMNFQHCNNFDENISSIDCNNDCLNDSITAEEVLKVVKDLKFKKSAGCDGITNEMIRVSCGKLVKTYVLIFNLIFKSGIFPSIWRKHH
ncbi:unnamed protein product [Mytilus coruscus]|uniref:Reverse transcriptase domain-containing protein n=1 Tax=Mytilus coruscus TaxID=42192 RepID=A0A6J8CK75_MYTCO|nr:unnamed protein product [Mytilus coruscus]